MNHEQLSIDYDAVRACRSTPSFAETRARRSDPETSKQAAKYAASGKCAEQRIAIRQALVTHGPMDPRQIEAVTGIEYHAVHKRMSEIAGIEPTGEEIEKRRIWRAIA
jgi:hypothetical protein